MTNDLPLLGFGVPVSGPWATPATIGHIARRAEALGYASPWTFQRVLTPVSGELGPAHASVLDPVVPLAFVAGHTDRIRLGTATVCAPSIAPAVLAKVLTSLDVLSAGRLTVGVGTGWLAQEYVAAGVLHERRGERMDEYLRCLRALWTEDPVEFAGELYTVPRSHVAPAPARRDAIRTPCRSSCAASSIWSTTTRASPADPFRARGSRCSGTSGDCARRASPRSSSTSTTHRG